VGLFFWQMSRIFLEQMIERKKGHIATISSSGALFPMPWAVIYSTSKSASNGFMLTLAEQLRFEKLDEFIKTTNVLPYVINTSPVVGHKFRYVFLFLFSLLGTFPS
jgi:all-trans-retinol dehydrogenase (NAD+)